MAKQLTLWPQEDRPNDDLAHKDAIAMKVIAAVEEYLEFATKHQLLDLLRANFGPAGFNVS